MGDQAANGAAFEIEDRNRDIRSPVSQWPIFFRLAQILSTLELTGNGRRRNGKTLKPRALRLDVARTDASEG